MTTASFRNSTRDAIKTAQIAKMAGADALLVTPVFYHGATPERNYEYYNAIGEAVGLPLIVYNVVPTNLISPEVMLKLCEIDHIVGIKQDELQRIGSEHDVDMLPAIL